MNLSQLQSCLKEEKGITYLIALVRKWHKVWKLFKPPLLSRMYPNFFKNKPTYPKPYNMRKLFIMQKSCKTVTNSNPYLENSLHKITIIFLQNLQVLNKGVNTFPLLSLNLCKILPPNHDKKKESTKNNKALNRTFIFTVIFD